MKVKQRLKIHLVLSVTTVVIVFLILSLALYRINQANNIAKIAGDIILNAFERVTLRNDYLQNNNPRAVTQWIARHETIDGMLKTALKEFPTADDRIILDDMVKKHESIGKIFSAMVRNRETREATVRDARIAGEVENRLLSQLNMKEYGEVVLGRELLESSRKARGPIMWQAGAGVICSFLVLLATAFINAWTAGRAITDRARRLRDGALVIGDGDLDHRIDVKGDDEFTELAAAFNAMTANLKTSYHNLEKEIEERKLVERALRENEERLCYHVENSPLAVVEWNAEFIVTRWAGEAEKIFGWSAAETVGNPIMDLRMIYEEDIPLVQETIEKLTDGVSRHVVATNRNYTKGGSVIHCTWYNTVLQDADGRMKSVMSQVLDITKRKRAEEDILQLSIDLSARCLELEYLNKEQDAFIYSVSHDLRAPLRTISAFARFLSEDYGERLDDQAKDYLTRITQGSEKMGHLISDLLDLSRLSRQEINRQEVDLSALAASVVSGLREADPGRTVGVSIEAGHAVSADPSLIEIVLSNLIGNAWKFTSKTANARIEFAALKNPPPPSKSPAGKHPSPEGTIYYVKDNGAGFDQQYAAVMFQPFHRLHSGQDYEGTGIGLAIVERLILRHGGKVWAEGETGKGTTMYFTLQQAGQAD